MPATTQAPPQAQHAPETWEHLGAGLAHSAIMAARPWACVAAEILAGYGAHAAWGHMPALPWAASGLTLATAGLTAWSWLVSRLPAVGRAHTAVTAAAAGGWLTVATIAGPFGEVTGGALGIGGGTLALSWMLRNAARRHHQGQGAQSAAPRGADRLKAWFSESAEEIGMKGAELHGVRVEGARATARAELPAGKTAGDLISAIPRIESAAGMPPGTITAVADADRADYAHVTVSDPRVLTQVQPWPGPSRPGASIAEPLRPGIWQDGLPVAFVITAQPGIFMMGGSGAGKSIGGCWNLLGEAMTRPDACILAADVTKGEQTFGPLRAGLHRFERDKAGVRKLVSDVHSIIQPRTDYLAAKGLQAWQPGCGLSFLIVWHEETGDIWDILGSKGEEQFISTARAIRSAGGILVCSVQRNTWDQLPTIIRAQMASMCFGLNDTHDCKFGLSTRQQNAGVDPSEWGIRTPGKAVLDAAGAPDDRFTMPLRTYSWGKGEEASSAMLAHASAYPASARPVDEITAQICGSTSGAPAGAATAVLDRPRVTITPPRPDRPTGAIAARPDGPDVNEDQDQEEEDRPRDDPGDPVGELLDGVEDPSPDITASVTAADLDRPIEPDPDAERWAFADAGEKMTPDEARTALNRLLADWRASGLESFAPRDLRPLMAATGMGRAWIQARLREMVEAGSLTRDDGRYAFADGEQ